MSPQNILFIRLRLLGDIIFTIPAIQLYKQHYPRHRIYYVAEEEFQEAAELIPGIHQVIVIPRKMGIASMWQFRKIIRSLDIDDVVDFHSGPKSAQLTRLTGVRRRIGYRTPNRNWAYTHLTPRCSTSCPTHSVYNQARLLEHLDIHVDKNNFPLYPSISPADKPIALAHEWQKILLAPLQKKVVIHVDAVNDFRD